jgi:Raf kinase inhibitor-like YbhB/YbcL family protein
MLIAGCSQQEGVVNMGGMNISSPSFADGGRIPDRYTCKGENVSPRIDIKGIPDNAKSLAIIVDDPDAPLKIWVHWIAWNITPISTIPEAEVPQGSVEGVNDGGMHQYNGPCPPPGSIHRYFFKVYALDTMLDIGEDSEKADLEKAMKGHVLAQATLVGTYSR